MLAKRAKLAKQKQIKLPPKMCKKILVEHNFLEANDASEYEVKMNHLVSNEEKQWLKRLEEGQTSSFLQKIKTDKRSQNADVDW